MCGNTESRDVSSKLRPQLGTYKQASGLWNLIQSSRLEQSTPLSSVSSSSSLCTLSVLQLPSSASSGSSLHCESLRRVLATYGAPPDSGLPEVKGFRPTTLELPYSGHRKFLALLVPALVPAFFRPYSGSSSGSCSGLFRFLFRPLLRCLPFTEPL